MRGWRGGAIEEGRLARSRDGVLGVIGLLIPCLHCRVSDPGPLPPRPYSALPSQSYLFLASCLGRDGDGQTRLGQADPMSALPFGHVTFALS